MSESLQTGRLAEEALAFINAGSARPGVNSPAKTPETDSSAHPLENTKAPQGAREGTFSPPLLSPRQQPEPMPQNGLTSMTFRLPSEIPAGLIRASAERKVRKLTPYTQQEIVAEALLQWLRNNGFLASTPGSEM